MKRIAIVPQQVTIAAPQSLVFELMASVDYDCRPGSGRTVSRISSEAKRLVAAFGAGSDQLQAHTVKEILPEPPDHVVYNHLSGPFAGAREDIRVRATNGGTELQLAAEFTASNEAAARLLKLSFEHAVQAHLLDLKSAAEDRLRPIDAAEGPPTLMVPIPAMTTEEELLAATEAQEEAEWGHVGHGRGVARVAVSLAEAIMLPSRQIDAVRRAAMLHDVGKVALDSSLWGLLGALTPEQRTMMEAHCRLGHDLAARAGLPEQILTGILHHHERWDGKGYPDGLAGEAIPLRARILGVAENIDSMLRATYRRDTIEVSQVAVMLEEGAGTHWDPMLARKAVRIMRGR